MKRLKEPLNDSSWQPWLYIHAGGNILDPNNWKLIVGRRGEDHYSLAGEVFKNKPWQWGETISPSEFNDWQDGVYSGYAWPEQDCYYQYPGWEDAKVNAEIQQAMMKRFS